MNNMNKLGCKVNAAAMRPTMSKSTTPSATRYGLHPRDLWTSRQGAQITQTCVTQTCVLLVFSARFLRVHVNEMNETNLWLGIANRECVIIRAWNLNRATAREIKQIIFYFNFV